MRPNSRFPTKKGKGKCKAVIDFTSSPSALSSFPSFSSQDWQEEGENQESQGERYIQGDKAQRHYKNAFIAYQSSGILSPSFQSSYNASRVLFLLATDHLPAPECFTVILESIAGYRAALALATGTSSTARIDGLFNLAQALSTGYEMVQEGASDGIHSDTTLVGMAWEAQALFAQVEQLQMAEMAKLALGAGDTVLGEEEAMQEVSDTATEEMVMSEAEETTTVTPYTIISTLLESLSNDIILFNSLSSDPLISTQLASSACGILDRASSLHQLIAQPDETQDLELSLAALNLASTFSEILPPSSPYYLAQENLISNYSALSSSHPSNPELLTEFADTLIDSLQLQLPSSQPVIDILSTAETSYIKAHELLSSKFKPPKSISIQLIPSLLASNLISTSFINLRLWNLSPPSSSSQYGDALKYLEKAHRLALESIDISGVGIKVTSDFKFTPIGISKPSWRTLKVFLDACFLLIRIRLRTDSLRSVTRVDVIENSLGRDLKKDLERYLLECRDDVVWKACGEGVEEQWWSEVILR